MVSQRISSSQPQWYSSDCIWCLLLWLLWHTLSPCIVIEMQNRVNWCARQDGHWTEQTQMFKSPVLVRQNVSVLVNVLNILVILVICEQEENNNHTIKCSDGFNITSVKLPPPSASVSSLERSLPTVFIPVSETI